MTGIVIVVITPGRHGPLPPEIMWALGAVTLVFVATLAAWAWMGFRDWWRRGR